MSAPLLALDRVSSGYGSSRVVRDVSLDIASGEIVALIGKNGMGKSTLLKTIMGFLRLQTGGIALAGRDIAAVPSHRKASLGLAYVPQEQPIFQDLTVHDNLRLGLASDAGLAAGIAEMAQAFPVLGRRLRQRAGTLSGGEQKMLIVARGLIARPRLMLLDEVTEGLQPSVVDRLAEALTAARRDRGDRDADRRAAPSLRPRCQRPFCRVQVGRDRRQRPGRCGRGVADRGPHPPVGRSARADAQNSVARENYSLEDRRRLPR